MSSGMLVLLTADLLIKRSKELILTALALVFMVGALSLFFLLPETLTGNPVFGNQVHPDGIAFFFRAALLFAGIAALFYSYKNEELSWFGYGEFLLLIMGLITGGMFLSMASGMVMLYLGIEFVSVLSYVLTAVRLNKAKSLEGAVKYILFGATASGVMLFGLSFIYGLTGSLDLVSVGRRLSGSREFSETFLLLSALAMTSAGLFYKVAAFPFHAWAPDVYEGSATPVTSFFSTAPKIAGFAVIIRILSYLMDAELFFAKAEVLKAFAVVGVLTMTVGNLAALWQSNLKRMFAYSSIAHAGYILAALAAWSPLAVEAAGLYLAVYLVMNTGAFLFLIAHTGSAEKKIQDFQGYAYRGPESALWAGMMAVFLFSLTGLPPFGGFIAKYYLFAAMVEKELYWLTAIAVINTVISLYYYAGILKVMYFEKEDKPSADTPVNWNYRIMGILLAGLTLLLGIFPQVISLPN